MHHHHRFFFHHFIMHHHHRFFFHHFILHFWLHHHMMMCGCGWRGMRMVYHVRVCGFMVTSIMRIRMVIGHSMVWLMVSVCCCMRVGRGRMMVGLRMMITVMRWLRSIGGSVWGIGLMMGTVRHMVVRGRGNVVRWGSMMGHGIGSMMVRHGRLPCY